MIVQIAALALRRLHEQINAIVQEAGLELGTLPYADKIRVGELLVEAYQRAYFQGVDLSSSLAQGHLPSMRALEACVSAYLCQPREVKRAEK